ncbi:4Fe-4S binding protein [Undibacterium baiyunense]|uniref:4Fe-4S binding protein n=1 Tax=Undibacterium baiyunense TaxID=2828731 RepID=A0A941I1D0_9BURK|nr:4Fe-4S binding protein [Undibacterium baiyunense]MBR7746258.1 4Fe-4S binding protein [Undibacterium baiyunense]
MQVKTHIGLWGVPVQQWRRMTQIGFFLLFVFAPIFDIFRLDLHLKHFIIFGMDWTLGLNDFVAGKDTATQAAKAIFLHAILPLILVAAAVIYVAWKWGRIYCGWLCPHFSIVETINQTLRRAIGKQSLWEKESQPTRNPDGSETKPDAIWWFGVIPLVIICAITWATVLLTYLLPPAEIYGNIWHGTLTRNQSIFLIAGSIAFFVEFMFARHLFCRYACALGLFQSLAWMGNDKAMVIGFKRERAKDCSTCYSACDHACPMRLNPRNVKRMMFACVQCGQCTDACTQTQSDNPKGNLLEWVNQAYAESEAALNGSTARVIQIKLENKLEKNNLVTGENSQQIVAKTSQH